MIDGPMAPVICKQLDKCTYLLFDRITPATVTFLIERDIIISKNVVKRIPKRTPDL